MYNNTSQFSVNNQGVVCVAINSEIPTKFKSEREYFLYYIKDDKLCLLIRSLIENQNNHGHLLCLRLERKDLGKNSYLTCSAIFAGHRNA